MEEFIQSSRNYVCVRLETFESKKHQDMVREFLNGRFENTAFCILTPDGKKRLTGAGRSPQMGMGIRGRPEPGSKEEAALNKRVIAEMDRLAKKYPSKAKASDAVVRDFHTFKQALNVSSGDQRLLVYAVAAKKHRAALESLLKPVANHPDVIGRYHFDIAGETDAKWSDAIDGDKEKTGIFIIRAGEFGQEGKVLAELPLKSKPTEIRKALAVANKAFSASEKRKVYSEHIVKGRREGVEYKDTMPWGEDRDADGKIDEKRDRSHRRRGRPSGPRRRGF